MVFVIWVVTGIAAGYLAGFLMKGRDYGLAGNLILGLTGSLVGGWVMALLGFNAPGDLLRHGLVSLLGAMVVLALARRLKPVSRQGRKVLGEVAAVADIEAQFKKLGGLRAQGAPAPDGPFEQAAQRERSLRRADDVRPAGRGPRRPALEAAGRSSGSSCSACSSG